MNIRNVIDVDLLYALFLGRIPEDNFVRSQRIGWPVVDLAKAMIESDEFAQSVVERMSSYDALPHRTLPLQVLPQVLAFVAEVPLAPPSEDTGAVGWREALGRVLSAAPCRDIVLGRYGDPGRLLIDALNRAPRTESINCDAEAGPGPDAAAPASIRSIHAGAEVVADSICRGWLVDSADPTALLHVRVRLNGRTVRILTADQFRRDVQLRYGGSGLAGFSFALTDLPDYRGLSRATIDISELESGSVVLPSCMVECSPFGALRDEAELRGTLRLVRDCASRLSLTQQPFSNNAGFFLRAIDRLWPKPAEPRSSSTDVLGELVSGLERLERGLPGLQHRQCWALPFYPLIRPLVELVPDPPPIHLGSFSILVIDDGHRKGAASATMASLAALTHPPQQIFWLARVPPYPAAPSSTVSIIPLSADQPSDALVNDLARQAMGTHLVVLDAGITLAPAALAWLAAAIESSKAPIIYSDAEEVGTDPYGTEERRPLFRPAFDYEILLQRNYIGSVFCIEREAFLSLGGLSCDVELDGRYDLLLRSAANLGAGSFFHIPLVLAAIPLAYRSPGPTGVQDRLLRTVQQHLDSKGSGARAVVHGDTYGRAVSGTVAVQWRGDPGQRISVIIPTRDRIDLIFAHLSSLRRHAKYWERIRIIVVVNGAYDDPLRLCLAEIQSTFENVCVIQWETSFNWCMINNHAVATIVNQGEHLLFINDDMICLSHEWDERLVGLLSRPEIGVVGARLLYPNGTIQHAGIAIGHGGSTAHEGMGDPAMDGLYEDRTLLVHQVGAVTGAFLACRHALFAQLGGFDAQRYAVTSGDADFCRRAHMLGKSVIYDPCQTWIHYESLARGRDQDDYRKQWRAEAEHELWRSSFSETDLVDLGVNPHFLGSVRPFEVFQRLGRDEVDRWFAAQLRRRDCWTIAAEPPTIVSGKDDTSVKSGAAAAGSALDDQ